MLICSETRFIENMERNSTKRKPNFTEGENLFLIDQYKHHKLNSGAILNNEKYQIWQEICSALNQRNPHTVRTVEEVRKRWKNMVCNAKKEALLFKRLQMERGGKGAKTNSKLSTVTKKIIELKEDFVTLHNSSGTCAVAPRTPSSSDSPVEVVIPNGQCVVIKTESIDVEGVEDDHLFSSSTKAIVNHTSESHPVTELPQPAENDEIKTTATGTGDSVTSQNTVFHSESVDELIATSNRIPSSSPGLSQSMLEKEQSESRTQKESFGLSNNSAGSPATQELAQCSGSSNAEVSFGCRIKHAPSLRVTSSQIGVINNVGLSRAAQRKRPLFSRLSQSHIVHPKKAKLNSAVSYRQETNASHLNRDSNQGEGEQIFIASERLAIEKERLSLEKEKLSMKKERHDLKKEKLTLEKQKLCLEIQRLKAELQQINGVKNQSC